MVCYQARSNLTSVVRSYDCNNRESPTLLKACIELNIPKFLLVPNINQIQKFYDAVLLNIIETHYAVTSWGKQAKLKERTLNIRPVLAEVRHERTMFRAMTEHKEVSRYKLSFDDGVVQLEPEVKKLLTKFLETHNYLWAANRDEQIEAFVKRNPLTADIRDKLLLYDDITAKLQDLDVHICLGLIRINCREMVEKLVEESKQWKSILGAKLCEFYRHILEENVKFIHLQNKTLTRDLVDLEDCRIAMECLKVIRDEFIKIDQSLMLMEQTYAMFQQFQLQVPAEDEDRVDGLRFQFNSMMTLAQQVSANVDKLQGPLLQELIKGVEKLKADVKKFDEDFVERGPMVEGIPAKEASDRVLLFDARVQELQNQYEIYSTGKY